MGEILAARFEAMTDGIFINDGNAYVIGQHVQAIEGEPHIY